MSRNCCSLCGVAGHNRRNQTLCRVNIERNAVRARPTVGALAPALAPAVRATAATGRPSLIDVRANLHVRHLLNARTKMDELARYIIAGPENEETGNYILTGVAKLDDICKELTAALRNDTLGVIDPSPLLTRLNASAMIFTMLCQGIGVSNTPLVIRHENRNVRLVVDHVQLHLQNSPIKNIVVLQSVDITEVASHDCPLCYETFAPTDTIYTNCHHGFCVTCIKGFTTSIKNKKPTCPMCRQAITSMNAGNPSICTEIQNHLSAL